jgi:hypothetical protein
MYLPPVFRYVAYPSKSNPPQTIHFTAVHIAVWPDRPVGELVVLVAMPAICAGIVSSPVFK